jgi:hypothetical protein
MVWHLLQNARNTQPLEKKDESIRAEQEAIQGKEHKMSRTVWVKTKQCENILKESKLATAKLKSIIEIVLTETNIKYNVQNNL